MDDLAKKLNDLLNSPDGMQKIQSMASSLGMLSSNPGEKSNSSSLAESVPAGASPSSLPIDGDSVGDLEMISKLMPLLSGLKADDQNTILLRALRPYLKDDRQQRLDESIKIMQLLKVLPLLSDKDIF